MSPTVIDAPVNEHASIAGANWVQHATLLWQHRLLLAKATCLSLLAGIGLGLVLPKSYESVTRIMPPDQQGSGAMMLAALASRSGGLGSLGSLAGGLLGGHTTTALFVDLLHSGTVGGHLIERFHLQQLYGNRYRMDTAKRLARLTTITDDKKSGVITIAVQDADPVRARDLAQGYLDELNNLVTATSTSSARQERIFIERRLHSVETDLEQAQLALSDFSSKNNTINIGDQTRAMVDSGARVHAEVLVERSGLDAMRQIYGEGNVRVQEAEARIASLERELTKMSGTSAPLSTAAPASSELYPPLRQLPRLAVPYADLYRRVKVQETVYELLTQQFEIARIEEAKDVPVVSVIDPPGIPERKKNPQRRLIAMLFTLIGFVGTAATILMRDHWSRVDAADPRKVLANEILTSLRQMVNRRERGAA